MISKKDLRVGNIIDCGTVAELRSDKVGVEATGHAGFPDTHFFYYKDVSPILLTEDIIQKCGFEIPKDGNFTLRVSFDKENGSLLKWKIKDCFELHDMRYLHQLQNLWYLLKNEELNYIP